MRRLQHVLLALTLMAPPARADVVIVDRQPAHAEFVIIDGVTDLVRAVIPVGNEACDDVVTDGAGWLFAGARAGIWKAPLAGVGGGAPVSALYGVEDIAFDSRGVLRALSRFATSVGDGRLVSVDVSSGDVTTTAAVPAFRHMGFDVPRAGPFEDGMILTGFDYTTPGDGYLYRFARQPDGSFVQDAPRGPLAMTSWDDAGGFPSSPAWHPTMRRSGLSFLMTESCTERVLEFDIDGNFLGVFAVMSNDPTVLDPLPGDPFHVFEDTVRNVCVAADDSVYVSMLRRVYHFAPDGTFLRKIDHLFERGGAIANLEWIPFDHAPMMCEAMNLGYWKRQCLPEERRSPRAPSRRGGVPRPRTHPDFRDGRLPDLVVRVDLRIASLGVGASEALWPTDPEDWQAKALMWFAAALFNFEDDRLDERCPIPIDGVDRKASDVLAEAEGLIRSGGDDAWRDAARLCQLLCHE